MDQTNILARTGIGAGKQFRRRGTWLEKKVTDLETQFSGSSKAVSTASHLLSYERVLLLSAE
jgi:hypothetical protein